MTLTLLIPLAGAALVAAATGFLFRPGDWYRSLSRPRWTPPDLAFPMVWTALYVLMTWAAVRLADAALAGGDGVADGLARQAALTALAFHGLQIVLNATWSPLFFGTRRPVAALVVVGLLLLAVLAEIGFALRADPWAALLLAPYPFWVGLAFALNLSIWRANPETAFGRPG
ncbi:MAG: TspO/MBR family protein [Pseudomonadota bacterium]|nr:TspO/MBR family protein [Pseudomonadota bacterium]MEE3098702.1 TspO/MBR family protein [Pseudomonadota bacterium]